jgi:hypothetical protein
MIFKFLFKSNDFSLTKEMSDLNILFFIFIFHISAKLPPPLKKNIIKLLILGILLSPE